MILMTTQNHNMATEPLDVAIFPLPTYFYLSSIEVARENDTHIYVFADQGQISQLG